MIKALFTSIVRKRSSEVVNRIKPYIQKSQKLIDIGSGTGDVAYLLQKAGFNLTPVDVQDFHGMRLVEPIIYDGKKLPFEDKAFDVALLLMVLHHTPNPEVVFNEAARVANNIVVIETSFTSKANKILTVVSDTVGNLRLDAYWNSYKSDSEWKNLFNEKKFRVIETKKYNDRNFGLPFLHIAYFLTSQ